MDYEIITILILLGFLAGVCLGGIITILCTQKDTPIPDITPLQRLIHSQRDSLRSLRTDFNAFRTTHERELMTILRETLRTSPRSIASSDEPTIS
jgi:hypothetical protein